MARAPAKTTTIAVRLEQLPHARGLPLPAYQTAGSAGVDLAAAVPVDAPIKLKPGKHALVPTGLKMELPHGTEAQVRPRSGLALKHGITVLNSPGTIDSDYRGEVQVILINLGKKKFTVARGERIAQLVIAPVTAAAFKVVGAVGATVRGSGGFGSTGVENPAGPPRSHRKGTGLQKKAAPRPRTPAGAKKASTRAPKRSHT